MSKSQNPTKEVIPIMKKRIYRRMPVNDFQPDSISLADLGGKLIFAIDVAKVDMVAALATADGRVLQTISWKAPDENPHVLEILRSFRSAGIPVEPVMEPSGTYGDVLHHQLEQDGFPLFMVSGKRTFDAREIFDGVPSLHDAKSAAIIARLHADNLSTRLRDEGPDRRQLRAALAIMDLHQERYLQLVHRLESWLARHWPELPTLIELTSSSLMALELYASLADRSTRKLLDSLARVDVLLVDEMGYLNLRAEQSNAFFKLMEERYVAKHTTLITTNLDYDAWYEFLGNKKMVEALLDRLRQRCHTITIEGPSLRTPATPAQL